MEETTNVELNFVGIPCYQVKDGEEYMNPAQQKHFIQVLTTWKSMLMKDADKAVEYLHENKNCPDPLDRAAHEDEQFFELRTRDRERKLIAKIDQTIETILKHDYGYCSSCDREIGIGRLEARPTATQCIDCKTFSEIKENREIY
ncbi:RNA polymerase-binding protein DksA [Gammaproteobacteria bacterium]|nr:RNA polymerase-binding protein DksA [Gammaproteobacteria bacterium]